MNKKELVALMAEHSGGSKVNAEKSLKLVLESIIKSMKKGHDISLIGFGSFNIKKREAREGRNPKTGQKMRIAAYKQPVFRAGTQMKEACNGK